MVATIKMLVKETPKCEEESNYKCCMKVETGTLVFAMLNCIFTGLVCMISTIIIIMNIFWDNYFGYEDAWMQFCITIVLGFVETCFLLAFAFGVVLAKGVLDRNPAYVKMYYIYGVVVAVLSWFAAIIALVYFSLSCDAEYASYASAGALTALFLYSSVLVMVRATYRKIRAQNQYQYQMSIEERY